uniref:Putative secreted protein n=1 Tax=Ixodes ricinus TaxID=34613 RepID=A0A6B0U3Z5_IXORI
MSMAAADVTAAAAAGGTAAGGAGAPMSMLSRSPIRLSALGITVDWSPAPATPASSAEPTELCLGGRARRRATRCPSTKAEGGLW